MQGQDTAPVEQTTSTVDTSNTGDTSGPSSEEVSELFETLGLDADKAHKNISRRHAASNRGAKGGRKNNSRGANAKGQGDNNQDDAADEATSDTLGSFRVSNKKEPTTKREKNKPYSNAASRVVEGGEADEPTSDEAPREASKRGDNSEPREGDGDAEENIPPRQEGDRPQRRRDVEARIGKLTGDRDLALARAEAAEQRLAEVLYKQQQQQIMEEDPEYTIDDFRRVQDRDGNMFDLDDMQAELAWRRWHDGYQERQMQREIQQYQQYQQEQAEERDYQEMVQRSTEAYDTLVELIDEYPELDGSSPDFDQDLSNSVMPLVEQAIQYAPGTEPGNPQGNRPVITGFKLNPRELLKTINTVRRAQGAFDGTQVNGVVEGMGNVGYNRRSTSSAEARELNEMFRSLGYEGKF